MSVIDVVTTRTPDRSASSWWVEGRDSLLGLGRRRVLVVEAEADDPVWVDDLSSMRRRQDRGELAADLDPATVRLVLLGAIAAPVVLPHMVRKIFGIDPAASEFETRYADGLRRLLNHLAPPALEQSTNERATNDG